MGRAYDTKGESQRGMVVDGEGEALEDVADVDKADCDQESQNENAITILTV